MKTLQPDTGTPKTLDEAIAQGLTSPIGGEGLRLHLLDFLAQKFGCAMMAADEKTTDALQALWLEIGKREKNET